MQARWALYARMVVAATCAGCARRNRNRLPISQSLTPRFSTRQRAPFYEDAPSS